MFFIRESKIFISNFIRWACCWVVVALVFFIFGLKELSIFGKNHLLPWPTANSFSVLMLKRIIHDLLPSNVHLIVTNPLSAFLVQLTVAFFLAFIVTMPFLLYGLLRYLLPALLEREKRMIWYVLFPSFFLFLFGCLFAYFLLIPATFKILYPYATVIGVTPFFALGEFVTLVASLVVATGVIFLLPIFMVLLSFFGLVGSDFWRKNWRYAVLFFVIFSAIITPDGTGITMAMLCLPLIGLYVLGYILIKKVESGRSKKLNSP